MKKKIHVLVFMLIAMMLVSVSFTGCSSDENSDEKDVVENQEAMGLDSSLEGMDLINSMKMNAPEKMILETETTGSNFASTATIYYSGENSRIETLMSGEEKQIMIYNAEKAATYQYKEGETTGIVMFDGEDPEDMEDMEETDDLTLEDIIGESSGDIIARVEMLDGEEVVYIETVENEEGVGDITVKMWYSSKYSIPLKYEMEMNGKIMSSYMVKNIKTDEKIDDKLFMPPSDVEFMDYDMDQLGFM